MAHAASPEAPSPELVAHARELLRSGPLIDGHNDTPWQIRTRTGDHLARLDLAASTAGLAPPMDTDIPRLRAGGVGAQFWSVYVPATLPGPEAVKQVLEQIDVVHRMAARWPEAFEMAYGPDDVRQIFAAGKIACLIGVEGGHSIDDSPAVLRQLYRAGSRYMTLTHFQNTDWADAATDAPVHHGLTPFGREVVREMNRLGMLVDLSHVSPDVMRQALETSEAPVIFSHSSARALVDHPRNVPDDVLRLVADHDGVVMVTFVEAFVSDAVRHRAADRAAEKTRLERLHPGDPGAVSTGLEAWDGAHPEARATLSQVADHIDHLRQVAGIDHVGIGSDFGGIPRGPVGLEDVSDYPGLLAELLHRGYTDEDVLKVAGGNLLRVFDRAETVAARLRAERPASEATLEELDGGPPGTPSGGDHS